MNPYVSIIYYILLHLNIVFLSLRVLIVEFINLLFQRLNYCRKGVLILDIRESMFFVQELQDFINLSPLHTVCKWSPPNSHTVPPSSHPATIITTTSATM